MLLSLLFLLISLIGIVVSSTTFHLNSLTKSTGTQKTSKLDSKPNKYLEIKGGSNVKHIHNLSNFNDLIGDHSSDGKLIVVDFTATWCGPCKMIAPFFDEMSSEFNDVCVFLKVDVDEAADVAQAYQVMSMPTFLFIKNGKVVDRFSGASVEKLRQVIFSRIDH